MSVLARAFHLGISRVLQIFQQLALRRQRPALVAVARLRILEVELSHHQPSLQQQQPHSYRSAVHCALAPRRLFRPPKTT